MDYLNDLLAQINALKERENSIQAREKAIASDKAKITNLDENKAKEILQIKALEDKFKNLKSERASEFAKIELELNKSLTKIQSLSDEVKKDIKSDSFVNKWGNKAEKLNDSLELYKQIKYASATVMALASPNYDTSNFQKMVRDLNDPLQSIEFAVKENLERTKRSTKKEMEEGIQRNSEPKYDNSNVKEKLFATYKKDIRVAVMKEDGTDLNKILKEANSKLYDKIKGKNNASFSQENLNKEIKIQLGDAALKEFQEKRQEEINKRKEIERQNNIQKQRDNERKK
jgi:hypothetical protein